VPLPNHADTSGDSGFRALTEVATDPAALVDDGGTIRQINAAVTQVLGYPPHELIGAPLSTLVHPDDQPTFIAAHDHPHATGALQQSAFRFLHRNGGWQCLEVKCIAATGPGERAGTLIRLQRRGSEPGAGATEDPDSAAATLRAIAATDDFSGNAIIAYQVLDADGRIVAINDTELAWLGYRREELVWQKTFRELLSPVSQLLLDRKMPSFQKIGTLEKLEYEMVRKDGSLLPILVNATAVTDADGRVIGSRWALYDITERRQAELGLARSNRALRVLSSISSEVVHAEEESALLEAVCRILVLRGGYRMAWVGFAQNDEARSVLPVAQAGFVAGYLEQARVSWADEERGRGPAGTAIRTGKPQVDADFLSSPRTQPWHDAARLHGFAASIALPLNIRGTTIGALTIYAAEPDAFDLREVMLLTELADDLAFGIATLRTRAEHQRVEAMVERLAYYDSLTGLPNRTHLLDTLTTALAAISASGQSLALLTMTVDGFHDIQAGIGVRQADQLLAQLARRIESALGPDEQAARVGGSTFVVLLTEADEPAAQRCAEKIQNAMALPFQQAGIPLKVKLGIGAVIAPGHGDDPDVLLVRAGIASRRARRMHADYQCYSGTTATESTEWLALISDLQSAIERRELHIHYQPKINLRTGQVSGVEALVRWPHPVRGMVPPGEFIPIAEKTGLIKPLTYAVLEAVFAQIVQWRAQQFEIPVAVNVSARNFADLEFVDRMLTLLRDHAISPHLLQLELTESTLMEEPTKSREQLVRLQAYGVTVSIDDFGTGYSSLAYVANLPIQSLKIDRSFVVQMEASRRMRSVIAGVISMGRALRIKTIAEGVETQSQAEALRKLGCDEIQGHFFSPALPAEALRTWVSGFSIDRYATRR